MKTMKVCCLLALLSSIMSCQREDNNVNGDLNNLPEKSAQIISSDNSFGLELFRKITSKAGNSGNTMVSPLSISLALSMVYNGAAGETKKEMENAMKLSGLTTEEINNAHKVLVEALQSADSDVLLEIANAIYYRQELAVKGDFVNVNKEFYDAIVKSLNFNSSDALKTINGWVATKTRGKIPTIIDSVDPSIVMILLNAIYFNGIWTTPFGDKKTHDLPFTFGDKSVKNVAQMNQEMTVDYGSNELFSAVLLPYGKGKYQMTVILPNADKSTKDVIAQMSSDKWKEWMKSMSSMPEVVVTMPRFKFSWEMKLNQILAGMGMKKAFESDAADFSGIADVSPNRMYIDFVIHKTFIDVNEKGTEAAAVTGIGMTVTSMPGGKTYFNVNRPFLFAITEKTTGTIMFIGEVNSPEYK